jgi:hypothetical protein
VLLVVPNGTPFLSDWAYTAFASQGRVLLTDPDDFLAGITKDRLGKYVIGITPVSQNFALEYRDTITEFRLQLFNLALALLVLLVSGVGVCIVHVRKNSQAIFVKHISGWCFAATHRLVIAAEVLIAAVLVAWLPLHVWMENQESERYLRRGMPPINPPVELSTLDVALTAGLVTVALGAVLLALAAFHRRVVRESVAEA